MRSTTRKRVLRTAAGTAIGTLGLGVLALAGAGSAFAATNPTPPAGTSQLGVTNGNPINISATVPTAITVTIGSGTGSNAVAFGSIQPGSSGTGTITDSVTSNDPSGYETALYGTNDGSSYLANNTTESCPENVSPVALATTAGQSAAQGTALTSYDPTGGVTRTIATAAGKAVGANGVLDPSAGAGSTFAQTTQPDYDYVTGQTSGTVQSNTQTNLLLVATQDNATASAAGWNQGLTGVVCSTAFNAGTYTETDSFNVEAMPWATLTAKTASGAATAFTENDTAGSYTDPNQNGGAALTLDTNPVILDSSNTVSGTAGSTTATTDAYTDTLALNVPGNQAAGSYQAAMDLLIWGK